MSLFRLKFLSDISNCCLAHRSVDEWVQGSHSTIGQRESEIKGINNDSWLTSWRNADKECCWLTCRRSMEQSAR